VYVLLPICDLKIAHLLHFKSKKALLANMPCNISIHFQKSNEKTILAEHFNEVYRNNTTVIDVNGAMRFPDLWKKAHLTSSLLLGGFTIHISTEDVLVSLLSSLVVEMGEAFVGHLCYEE
jgi:hypothetical protein